MLNQEYVKDSQIRIMSDCYAGAGCVIRTTMTLTDKVVPNLVGVDIGCGMLTIELEESESEIDLKKLDQVIRQYVPSGFNVHKESKKSNTPLHCEYLRCFKAAKINDTLAYRSVGTLGGGNHFLELDRDEDRRIYLVIHTGSRHLGLEVAGYYQDLAWSRFTNIRNNADMMKRQQEIINDLKANGRQNEIEAAIRKLHETYKKQAPVTKELAYLEGDDFKDYIHDMQLVQTHAGANRAHIAKTIGKHMGFHDKDAFETIHNYIDTENMILRKAAVSAQEGEKLLIPMNMRDGSFICVGKGNPDWNCSAPHGAGRLMSRSKAKEILDLDAFEDAMSGIYTTSVNRSTIDESPFVYKPMESIRKNIQATVDIVKHIRPIYNFKASDV